MEHPGYQKAGKSVGTQFHKSLNTLATDALYLKASLATVAAPVVDALAPALDYLTDKIAGVLNLLAQLFAKLSGKSVYTRAVKTQTEYTDSISKAAGKTKDFLADFDELNVFNNNSGGSGSDLPDFKSMFEEAEVDSDLGNFVDRLKAAFGAGDWDGLGKILADKVNELMDRVDWKGIGSKIGYGINGAIKTAYSFLSYTDFRKFGNHIADFINAAVSEINFNTAGRLLTRGFTAIFDFAIGGLERLDWGLVTNSSHGGVNSTTFGEYANTIITSFKNKVSSTYSTVKSSITTWASSVKDWFTGNSFGGVNSGTFSACADNIITGFKNKVSNTYTRSVFAASSRS